MWFRAKALMLNVSEDEVVPFPLDLSSPRIMIATNNWMLNYLNDVRHHVHLIKCEECLKKVLKISNFSKIDWALRASIISNTPNYVHLWLSKVF